MQRYDIIGQADLPASIDVRAPVVDVRALPRPFDPLRPPLPAPAAAEVPPSDPGGGFTRDPEEQERPRPPPSNIRCVRRGGPADYVEMWAFLNIPKSTAKARIPRGAAVRIFQDDVEVFGPIEGRRRPPANAGSLSMYTFAHYQPDPSRPPATGWIQRDELLPCSYGPSTGQYASIGQVAPVYARCAGSGCKVFATRPYLARGTLQVPKIVLIELLRGTRVRVLRRTFLPGYIQPNLDSWRRWTLVQIGTIRGWIWDLGLTPAA